MTVTKRHVDYAQLKRDVSLVMVLSRYGLLEGLKRTGRQLRGTCPIHGGSNMRQFLVNPNDSTWRCFGDCDRGGSTLEFVAELEHVDIQEAAVRIASWFSINQPHNPPEPRRHPMSGEKPSHKAFVVEERGEGNDADAFWTRVGSAWPHKDGKGLNIVLSALPVNGRIVLREYDDDDATEDAKKAKPKQQYKGR